MTNNDDSIIVVSGLPRSGTSMMMQILNALNVQLYTDNHRPADKSNPRGYYEHQDVKKLENDSTWLKYVKGKAVKIISPLLIHLPKNFQYKIIFMLRDINEIIHSQNKMLNNSAKNEEPTNPQILKTIFDKNILQIKKWQKENPNAKILYLNYVDFLNKAEDEVKKIQPFLNLEITPVNLSHIISRDLYRSRKY